MLIVIPGQPMHKPGIRAKSWKKWRRWADGVAMAALAHGRWPAEEPLALDVACFFAIPKSWSQRKAREHQGQGMRSKPDGNHLWNAVADALYRRDERIVDQRCVKFWDDGDGPRVEVWIRAWGGRAEWLTRARLPDGTLGITPPELPPCNHIPPGKCFVCSTGPAFGPPKHLLTARRLAR